ncbi:MAG TPA: peroxidase family protein [Gaiellaceae bacterium]
MRGVAAGVAAMCAFVGLAGVAAASPTRTLDGEGNNVRHPTWGEAGTRYLRIAAPAYADGIGRMVPGRPARFISNRIFNDVGQNLFSENDVTQWGWVWGQFLDHDFGLRDERVIEIEPIGFSAADPLESFRNDFNAIDFWRTPPAPDTGVTTPRQYVNRLSSYIDASNVYGIAAKRLDWLRVGKVDGRPADNSPKLLLTNGYLPRVDARGDPKNAPAMDLFGALVATPQSAIVAGDTRANGNVGLTAVHTLFAREHNRIVRQLPSRLSAEQRFQIARRVVGAEEQYITYTQFLPALGVSLHPYHGYNRAANGTLSNEFAEVGFRAHSMINGDLHVTERAGRWSAPQLAAFASGGIGVASHDALVTLDIPLVVALGNPTLLERIGVGPVSQALASEREYSNDEQIDDALRSVLFRVPKPGVTDPRACDLPVVDPRCFNGVQDLGAVDVERARDHGIPAYNALRQAYGLAPKASFGEITGETNDPADASLLNAPAGLAFVELRDRNGNPISLGSPSAQQDAVTGVRRTTLAARLQAIYGDVSKLDAFVGMMCERHAPGTEFGDLQLAIWQRQFEALRDGDRFFYANDPALVDIKRRYGIAFRRTLAQVIEQNSDGRVQSSVFRTP